MKVQTDIIINTPIERVFNVFTDLEKLSERIDGIQSVEVLEKSPQMQVGTKWKETRVMFGKASSETMWVSELNKEKNYVVLAESHGTKYRSEYIFRNTPNGTSVKMTFEGIPVTFISKILGVIFSFMSGSMAKMLHKDMEDLKKVCEEIE
jgi:uncharacterized membrane protein